MDADSPTAPVVVSANNLRMKFPSGDALHGVSLEIRAGEVVGILGPNGAGKTTLLSLLGGLHFPTRGTVHVFGKHRWRENFAIRQNSFFLPSTFIVGPTRHPYEYFRLIGQVYGLAKDEFLDRVAELSDQMRILDALDKPWKALSLGTQKKAGLVACFLPKVDLRILDEPFAGGIDPFAMEMLYEWFEQARQRAETTVFSTQVLDQAEIICNRVGMIDRGKLVAFDAPANIIARAGLNADSPRAFAQAFFRLMGGNQP